MFNIDILSFNTYLSEEDIEQYAERVQRGVSIWGEQPQYWLFALGWVLLLAGSLLVARLLVGLADRMRWDSRLLKARVYDALWLLGMIAYIPANQALLRLYGTLC